MYTDMVNTQTAFNTNVISATAAETTTQRIPLEVTTAVSPKETTTKFSYAKASKGTPTAETKKSDGLTSSEMTKRATDEWLAKQRKDGKVVGFFKLFPTKKQLAMREEGKTPKPIEGVWKKKIRSVEKGLKDKQVATRTTKRDGHDFDGKPIIYKLIYVAWNMSPDDAEEFKTTPYEVKEEQPKGQDWQSIIQIKCYDADLKKDASKITVGFQKKTVIDPLVDVKKYADGLPEEFNPEMRMPRCYGRLYNVPPGSPYGNGIWCAKSGKSRDGKDKGPCQWNLGIWKDLKEGKRQTRSWCQYNHYTIRDAGIVDAETYELFKKMWLEDSKKMMEYSIEMEKQQQASKERSEKRAAAKADAAKPDDTGFSRVYAGSKAGSKANSKAKEDFPKLKKSGFGLLEVESSSETEEDDDEVENEVIVLEAAEEPKVEPKEEPMEEPAKKIGQEKKISRGKKGKRSRGVPFNWVE